MRVVDDSVGDSRHVRGVQPEFGFADVRTDGFPVREIVSETDVEDFAFSVRPRTHAGSVEEIGFRIGVGVGRDAEGFDSGILSEGFEGVEKECPTVFGVEPDADRRFLKEGQIRSVRTRYEAVGFLGVPRMFEEKSAVFAGFFRREEILLGMQPPDFHGAFPMVGYDRARKHPVGIGFGIGGEMDDAVLEIAEIRQRGDFRPVSDEFEFSSHGGG